jgi:uncharacterized membrane protein YdjX (TVP38/TMEM64 family)
MKQIDARLLVTLACIVMALSVTTWAAAAQISFLPRNILWDYLGLSEKTLLTLGILLTFCLILLSHWESVDHDRIEELEQRIRELEKQQAGEEK